MTALIGRAGPNDGLRKAPTGNRPDRVSGLALLSQLLVLDFKDVDRCKEQPLQQTAGQVVGDEGPRMTIGSTARARARAVASSTSSRVTSL